MKVLFVIIALAFVAYLLLSKATKINQGATLDQRFGELAHDTTFHVNTISLYRKGKYLKIYISKPGVTEEQINAKYHFDDSGYRMGFVEMKP